MHNVVQWGCWVAVVWMLPGVSSMADELAPEQPEQNPVKEVTGNTDGQLHDQAAGLLKKPGVTRFGNITVSGGQQQVRGGIASMAKSLQTELNALVGDKGRELAIPLVVRLYGKPGDKAPKRLIASEIRKIEGQYQLLVYVHLARGVDRGKLRYHLMEMLLYERGLGAGQTLEAGESVIVRPWLVVGLLNVIELQGGRGDRGIFQLKISYFEVLSLQRVFAMNEKQWRDLNGREELTFRALSGAMVSSLIRQPKGRPSMGAYLGDFATFKGEPENLMRKHFPAMNTSRNSLEKWVSLEMLELGTALKTEVFSILETENRLSSILKLRYRDKDKVAREVPLEDYEEVVNLEGVSERGEAVAGATAELERLSYRCFPMYRPLLSEYRMILRDIVLAKKKHTKTIPQRLKNLKLAREKNVLAGQRVRDYMDWYYITQSDDVSGSFQKYRQLMKDLDKESQRARVNSSTGKYLDSVQRLFGGW